MAGVLIGFPSSNVAPEATPSWVAPATPASGYAVTNMLTLDPGVVAKANETTAKFRLAFSGTVTPEAIFFGHTNWGGAASVTLTNGGSLSVPVTIRESQDGLCECGWADLRGVAGAGSTDFYIEVVGADGPVAIGCVIVLTSVEAPRTRWQYLGGERMPKVKLTPASGAQDFVFSRPTRRRKFRCTWHWAEDRELWRRLWREAYSVTPTPFVLIPDEDDVDAALVQFVDDDFSELYEYFSGSFADNSQSGIVETQLDVLEVGAGAPLP